MHRKCLLILPAVLVLALGACGDDDDDASASASPSASGSASAATAGCEVIGGSTEEETAEIHAVLAEYSIEADTEVGAGVVAIDAANEGSVAHEIVVLEGPPSAVEVNDAGEVDETNLVGEIEAFDAGTSCEGLFALSPGEYTLLCAIVEESGESHYGEGMVTGLTVT